MKRRVFMLIFWCTLLSACSINLKKTSTLLVIERESNAPAADVPVHVRECGMNVFRPDPIETRTDENGMAQFTFPNTDMITLTVGPGNGEYYLLLKRLRDDGGLVSIGVGSEERCRNLT